MSDLYVQTAGKQDVVFHLTEGGPYYCTMCGQPGATEVQAALIDKRDSSKIRRPYGARVYCPACAARIKAETRAAAAMSAYLKQRSARETAMISLDAQYCNVTPAVLRAAEQVRILQGQGLKLGSMDEAILLILAFAEAEKTPAWGAISYCPEVKIGQKKYYPDFVFYQLKIIVEVDGEFHGKEDPAAEDARDEKLRQKAIDLTGDPSWEVVRIPTTTTRHSASTLLADVLRIAEEKRALRAQTGGGLPADFRDQIQGYSNWQLKRNQDIIAFLSRVEEAAPDLAEEAAKLKHDIWIMQK